jgi:GDP-L-fucose synthase
MSLLITGGRGLLGRHILSYFSTGKVRVLAPNRLELDCSNYDQLIDYISRNDVREIIHCAAKVGGISENIRKPADFILKNLSIDSSLLSAARFLGVEKLLYFGSSCIYPPSGPQPFNEKQLLSGPLEPTNEYYALAKSAGVKSVESVASQDGLIWRSLILSNIYGPGDDFSAEESHLIGAIIRKVLLSRVMNLGVVDVWGNGSARREFTYVGDIANFIGSVWEDLHKLPLIMNLGVGKDFSVEEYYRAVCEVLDYSPVFNFDPSKPNGMGKKLMDSALAIQYGWSPKTTLQSGLLQTVNWFERRSNE